MPNRNPSRAPSRQSDPGKHGEDFPDAARLYPGYAHDFTPAEDKGEFSEEFKSWRKNRESVRDPAADDSTPATPKQKRK